KRIAGGCAAEGGMTFAPVVVYPPTDSNTWSVQCANTPEEQKGRAHATPAAGQPQVTPADAARTARPSARGIQGHANPAVKTSAADRPQARTVGSPVERAKARGISMHRPTRKTSRPTR